MLVDERGQTAPGLDRQWVERRLESETFFWLDLHRPGQDEFALLRDVFGLHPLALEDAQHFGQRPKLEGYDDFVLLVAYGATSETEDRLAEVHCFFSRRYLITVHRVDLTSLRALHERQRAHIRADDAPAMLLYRVVDQLVDSFFEVLAELDDRIDQVEAAAFRTPSERRFQEVFDLKELVTTLRKIVTPQRDVFARVAGGVEELPGWTRESERYFRDVYDHLIRITDLLDSYRDLLTSVTDLYLSTVSNRLNVVMKQLSVIATIFLPLSFLTSFFGQNFGWLVGHIGGLAAFAGIGVGTELVSIALMIILFRRRGWLS